VTRKAIFPVSQMRKLNNLFIPPSVVLNYFIFLENICII